MPITNESVSENTPFDPLTNLIAPGHARYYEDGMGRRILAIDGVKIHFETYQDAYIIHEVFVEKCYRLEPKRPSVAIDIGMNVAITSLYLAHQPRILHVYGYELFEDTFVQALHNLLLNPVLSGKITAYNRGVWSINTTEWLDYNYEWKASLGVQNVHPSYLDEGTVYEKRQVELVDAASVVRMARSRYPDVDLIAKLDCEGSEYEIVKTWLEAGQLAEFASLSIEWHDVPGHSVRDLLVMFAQADFIAEVHSSPHATFGMLYATGQQR